MTDEEFLRRSLGGIEVNGDFSEAVVRMRDGSSLHFRHTVGERWARAEGTGNDGRDSTEAGQVLSRITQFRLNAKHLEIRFADGSRWEAGFPGFGSGAFSTLPGNDV
jgi:hypothetical protein